MVKYDTLTTVKTQTALKITDEALRKNLQTEIDMTKIRERNC